MEQILPSLQAEKHVQPRAFVRGFAAAAHAKPRRMRRLNRVQLKPGGRQNAATGVSPWNYIISILHTTMPFLRFFFFADETAIIYN